MVRSQIAASLPAAAAITEALLPSHKEIAQAIPDKTALVEFFVGPNRNLTTFVLTSKGLRTMTTIELGPNDLDKMVEEFRAEIESEVDGVPSGEKLFLILFLGIWDAIAPMERRYQRGYRFEIVNRPELVDMRQHGFDAARPRLEALEAQ